MADRLAVQDEGIEITPQMIEAGVNFCLDAGVENVAFLDDFVSGLYTAILHASPRQRRAGPSRASCSPER
jgi:hypothetical protein